MSGGSYDYRYTTVSDLAGDIRERHSKSALHVAFAEHLDLVAKALHDIEWVDSCDYGPGDDHAAIRAVIGEGAELVAATKLAMVALKDLEGALARARKVQL